MSIQLKDSYWHEEEFVSSDQPIEVIASEEQIPSEFEDFLNQLLNNNLAKSFFQKSQKQYKGESLNTQQFKYITKDPNAQAFGMIIDTNGIDLDDNGNIHVKFDPLEKIQAKIKKKISNQPSLFDQI